jgi:Raf kinase inhibitor-like YbhB/YbcL family protein
MSLTLTSPAFQDGGLIPSRFTCDGENVSPEMHIDGVPEGTKSLVLVADDPDIPDSVKMHMEIEKFDHWTIFNIPPETKVIPAGGRVGTFGLTSRGGARYVGPCPPDREHRYFFRLYALRDTLTFSSTPTLKEVEDKARSLMIETATLMGRYSRINQ